MNQFTSALAVLGVTTFVAPLALRALLKNVGINVSYGKAMRLLYAARLVSYAITVNSWTPPRGEGPLLKDVLQARQKTPNLPPRDNQVW